MGRRLVKTEAQHDDADQPVALDLGHRAVDHGGMDQQRRGGEAIVVVLEAGVIFLAAGQIGQKLLECLQHDRPFSRSFSAIPAMRERPLAAYGVGSGASHGHAGASAGDRWREDERDEAS